MLCFTIIKIGLLFLRLLSTAGEWKCRNSFLVRIERFFIQFNSRHQLTVKSAESRRDLAFRFFVLNEANRDANEANRDANDANRDANEANRDAEVFHSVQFPPSAYSEDCGKQEKSKLSVFLSSDVMLTFHKGFE